MFSANIFNAKVIYNKAEGDGAGLMAEETRGMGARVVAMGRQVEFDLKQRIFQSELLLK